MILSIKTGPGSTDVLSSLVNIITSRSSIYLVEAIEMFKYSISYISTCFTRAIIDKGNVF